MIPVPRLHPAHLLLVFISLWVVCLILALVVVA